MIYEKIGELMYYLSNYLEIKPNSAFLIISILFGIPHIKTFSNWKNPEIEKSRSRFWAKLYLVVLVIAVIGVIFDG